MLATNGVVKYTVVCGQIKAADWKCGKTNAGTMPDFHGHLRHQMSRKASRTQCIFGILAWGSSVLRLHLCRVFNHSKHSWKVKYTAYQRFSDLVKSMFLFLCLQLHFISITLYTLSLFSVLKLWFFPLRPNAIPESALLVLRIYRSLYHDFCIICVIIHQPPKPDL